MSYFHIQYHSRALKGDGEFLVFLPDRGKKPYKVLWLLHGAFSETFDNIFGSCIVRYAQNNNMAVIAPSSYLGVYTDMKYGEASYSMVKELFETVPKLVGGLSPKREDNTVLGISMGGHGAYKLALEFPERICAAAAFSSPIDMVYTMSLLETGRHNGGHELQDAFGSSAEYSGTVGDTVGRAKALKASDALMPRFFLAWGDEDHAKPECTRLAGIFKEEGISIETEEGRGGHNFDTWEPLLERTVAWLAKGGETAWH